MSNLIQEPVADSKIPGVILELSKLLKKEFNLADEEILIQADYLYFVGKKHAFGSPSDVYLKKLPKIQNYCKGFLDAIDIHDYMCTEYLNDR